jgi:pyridoxine 5'-phosphate synthase PdxJ
MEYQHNSLPIGITMGKMGKKKYEFPDEAREEAFLQATVAEDKKEITLNTNKGHYLEIGNVINLVTPEYPELTGKHRILSKSVQCGGSKVSCKLKLSRESSFLADYLGEA